MVIFNNASSLSAMGRIARNCRDIWENVGWENDWWENVSRENVLLRKCRLGKCRSWEHVGCESVALRRCLVEKMTIGKLSLVNCRLGSCRVEKISFGKMSENRVNLVGARGNRTLVSCVKAAKATSAPHSLDENFFCFQSKLNTFYDLTQITWFWAKLQIKVKHREKRIFEILKFLKFSSDFWPFSGSYFDKIPQKWQENGWK